MDTIVTPVTVITLDSTRIVHSIKADLVARYFPPVVRLVQYDQSLPVIAVSLMKNGQAYTLPNGAAANIRVHKPDATYVYNPALGCDSTRNIVYFEVTQAMAAANGDGLAIVEIVVDGDIAGTSLITLHFEENPVPENAIESSDEWETIYELGERIIASTVTPVSTAAGMTDQNVVYLYTGTETGWNQGHMYYYNGSTWVDAGIASTDKTLTVEGMAADAKATGDEITSLKEDLKDGLSKVTGETRNLFNLNNLFVGYAWNGSVNTTRACAYIPILGGEEYIISFPTATASRFDAITAFEKVNISDTTNLYLSGISSGFTRTASSSAKFLGIQFTKTGITKADLDDLAFQVEYGNKTSPFIQNETATDLTVRGEMVTFITPEMFGAWGDGVHDDTAALQAALDTAKNVKANKTYKITSSLTMTPVGQFGQRFYFNKIICSVNQPALVLNGRNGYVDGLYLESPNDCIKLGNTTVSYDWYIHVSWAKSTGGSTMTIGGGGNVSECTIVGERFTYYSEGVHFDLTAGFVGQNRIIGVAFECISDPGTLSGWAFSANGSSYPMTGLALFDVSLEGAHGGFNFANSQVSLPINPLYCFGLRTSELTDVNGYKLFRLTGNGIIAGDIFGDIINLDSIDVTLHNPNILYEQSFNFHGRLKWKGRGWQNARIVGNKIVPKFAESYAANVVSPVYDDNNLPYTTNLISGTASWDVTFPFDGEIVFIATSANTQLTINGSVIAMNNTEVVKVRTELWQNPSQPSDIRTNVLINRPNGTIAVKTLS